VFPDIKTLMLLYLATNVVNAGAMAVIWKQNRDRFQGLSCWFSGLALQAAGSILTIFAGIIPDLISMTLANTIVLCGAIIVLNGLGLFTGKKVSQVHNIVILVIYAGLSAYFNSVNADIRYRGILVSIMIMIYTFQSSWLLLKRVDPDLRPITRLAGILFAIYAAFNLARIISISISPAQSNNIYEGGVVMAAAMTGYILLNICVTISLILMVSMRLQHELLQAATHDELTGLPNRRIFYDRFSMAVAFAQRNRKRFALMSLDLDKFKAVNDTLGHNMGDKLLTAIAARLSSSVRKSDTVARIGGDEFVILMSDVEDSAAAGKAAENLLGYFRKPFVIDGRNLNVSISIGVAVFPDDGSDMEEIMKASDHSLYSAKASGGNKYSI